MAKIDQALSELDAICVKQVQQDGVPKERAMNEGRKAFASRISTVCTAALEEQDLRIARAVQQRGHDALYALQKIGSLLPVTMLPQEVPMHLALQQFVGMLDETRDWRAHSLGERLGREVSIRRGRTGGGPPLRTFAMPGALSGLLSAADVARVAAGGFVVCDPNPVWLDAAGFAVAERELRQHVHATGLLSTSSCNTNATTTELPLSGEGFGLSAPTLHLLRMLNAVPAMIEEFGWPRRLCMPPLLQLASYTAEKRASYSPHFDSNPWERHNHRACPALLPAARS